MSPTLPGSFPGRPPVDVPAAMFPFVSRATAPTVSPAKSSLTVGGVVLLSCVCSWASCCVSRLLMFCSVMPSFSASLFAPSPTMSMWSVCSIIFLARVMGWKMFLTAATHPVCSVAPFIIMASSSYPPSLFREAPLPALK